MSRYAGPSCRLCRREGTKLFLKGEKCLTEKCPVERRAYPPGQHGPAQTRVRKASEYSKQLREKQKVKRMYGLTERQFRNTFELATTEPGVKGTNLLIALETRLDNIVYRLGFAASRKGARQLVRHGHVQVNGGRVDVPSFRVAVGMEVRVVAESRENVSVLAAQQYAAKGSPVKWLSVDGEKASGRLLELPTRDAIPTAAQEQLIVELYSK